MSVDAADVRARLRDAPLELLDLDPQDRALVDAAIAGLDGDGAQTVATAASALVARIGAADDAPHPFRGIAARPGDAPGMLPILALVATASDVVTWLSSRGLDDATAASGVADLGQQLRVHRRATGIGGTDAAGWLATPWTGSLLRHGTLQIEHVRHETLGFVRSLHVPDGAAIDRASLDETLATSLEAGAIAFPERATDIVHCVSWMLDPWLADALPGSRLGAFAARWDAVGDEPDDDGASDVLWFVWGRRPPWPDVASLPQDSSLRRAIAARVEAGERPVEREGVLAR